METKKKKRGRPPKRKVMEFEGMKASAWQKAVNEDQDNDFVHAIDSAKRRIAEPIKDKVSKPQRLQQQEKKRDRLSDEKAKSNKKLNRQENKLNEKHDSYKKRKKKPKPKNKQTKKSLSDIFKSAWKFVKNVYEKEVKKFFASLAVPVIIILLVFAFIIMIFSSTTSGGGFTLGTYAAQDYDLSEAEKYYTELAYNLNEKVRKVGDSSDWKDGLKEFGAKKKDLKDTPDNWYWGQSSVYDWKPQYDFDCYKLWAFLCAYYYDFDADDNGDIKYWKFKSDTKTLLEEIFNAEYEFVYWYDNKSRWENLDNYVYFGGGNVKQKKTFEEVITDKLGSMSHSTERLQYYNLLAGKEDGTGTLYGNHQTLYNLLPDASICDYTLKREFGYEMTGWNEESDGLYQGIKVYASSGTKLKAPFKCKITDVDTSDNKITIRKDDVEYWYDGNGGTKRDTEVTIANAKLLSGYSEGDTIDLGEEFAKTTAGNVNFHIYIDTDGYGWDYIDPRLVLY